jgi:hypothetical protein
VSECNQRGLRARLQSASVRPSTVSRINPRLSSVKKTERGRSTTSKKNPKKQKNHQWVNAISVDCERDCRVQVCGRRLSPVLRFTGPMSALSLLCGAASTSPPYIYIYDSFSIGASGCNRLKGHIYICVCAFFLLDIFFTPLTLTYPHEARAGQVFYGEKRMSKIWPGLLELISRFWPLPSCSCSLPLPLPSHHI